MAGSVNYPFSSNPTWNAPAPALKAGSAIPWSKDEVCKVQTANPMQMLTGDPSRLASDPLNSRMMLGSTADLSLKLLSTTPKPVAPPGDPTKTRSGKPFNEEIAAANAWAAIKERIIGVNGVALYEEWKDYTPQQLRAVEANFKDHYEGKDLWKEMKDKQLPAEFQAKLRDLYDGKRGVAAGKNVLETLNGGAPLSKAGDLALAELRGLTQEELRDMKLGVPGISTRVSMNASLSSFNHKPYKQQEAMALVNEHDKEKAARIRLNGSLKDKDGAEAVRALRDCANSADRAKLVSQLGKDKLLELASKLPDQDVRNEATGLIKGQIFVANAAQLHGLVKDKDAFMARFGELVNPENRRSGPGDKAAPPESDSQKTNRELLLKRYQELYHETPLQTFQKAYPKEAETAKRIASQQAGLGENRMDLLNDSLHGKDTSLSQLKRSFSGLSADDANGLIAQYERVHGKGTFKKDIDEKFSGRDEFKAAAAGLGAASGRQELERARKLLAFEKPSMWEGASSADDNATRSFERAEQAFNQADSAKMAGNNQKALDLTLRGEQLTRYGEMDIGIYAHRKDELTNGAANAATTLAVTGAAILTDGAVLPFLAAVGTTEVTHWMGDGNAYNLKDAEQRTVDNLVNTVGPMAAEGVLAKVIPKGPATRAVANVAVNTSWGVGQDVLAGKPPDEIIGNAVTSTLSNVFQGVIVGIGREKVAEMRAGNSRAAASSEHGPTKGPVRTDEPGRVEVDLREGDANISYDREGLTASLREVVSPELRQQAQAEASARSARVADLDQQIAAAKGNPAEQQRLSELRRETSEAIGRSEKDVTIAISNRIHDEAERVTAQAKKEGRLTDDGIQTKMGVAWKITNDLRQAGVPEVKDARGLVQAMSPFKVTVTPESVPHGADPRVVPDSTRTLSDFSDTINTNRALEPNPPKVVVGDHEVAVYGARDNDLRDATVAFQRMAEKTPVLTTAVAEIHNTKVIERKVATYEGGKEAGLVGGTAGLWQGKDATAITVTSKGGYENEALYAKQRGDGLARDYVSNNPDSDLGWAKGAARDLYKEMPAAERPLNSKAWTISHEIAHAWDRDNKWISASGKIGPFGQGDGQHGTDYVSGYAGSGKDPLIRANEDFAETAAFLANFEFTKPDLGTLSPTLEAKLRGAGEVLGSSPEYVQSVIDFYNKR